MIVKKYEINVRGQSNKNQGIVLAKNRKSVPAKLSETALQNPSLLLCLYVNLGILQRVYLHYFSAFKCKTSKYNTMIYGQNTEVVIGQNTVIVLRQSLDTIPGGRIK